MQTHTTRSATTRLLLAAMHAMTVMTFPSPKTRRARRVPVMVTSSPEEIAAWNRDVEAKRHRPAKKPKRFYLTGQHPKLTEPRQRKQHKHPLRDDHGAFTLVGSVYEVEGVEPDPAREFVLSAWTDPDGSFGYTARRKWLGGISAQRGY